MTEFERELVKAFNRYFEDSEENGIAYRRKQHRFSSQFVDVLVDSIRPEFYLAIENKSISTSATNKLYFSQHFSESEDGHQVERISRFLRKSGRKGFLAVEVKRGRGHQRKAYLIPWKDLKQKYDAGEAGVPVDDLEGYIPLQRVSDYYTVAPVFEEVGR